jgi:hypothetical protein
MLIFIAALLIAIPCATNAATIDLSLSNAAAIHSATAAGYEGSRRRMRSIGREREALYLAKGMAVECHEDDLSCALGAVAITVMTRAALASSPGVAITPGEILATPYQYTGFTSSPLLLDKKKLRKRIRKFLPVARFVIAGGLNGRYRPSTHYAIGKTFLSKKWGKAFVRAGFSFYLLPDGHLVLDGIARFRLPGRAARRR